MLFPPCALDCMPLVEPEPTTEYQPTAGESVYQASEKLCARATIEGRAWAMVFNGRRVIAHPGDPPLRVCERWSDGAFQ